MQNMIHVENIKVTVATEPEQLEKQAPLATSEDTTTATVLNNAGKQPANYPARNMSVTDDVRQVKFPFIEIQKHDSANIVVSPQNTANVPRSESPERATARQDSSPLKMMVINNSTRSSVVGGPLKKQSREKPEVLVGTPVQEGHSNYLLMYDMLTGIRISVSRTNLSATRDLEANDYTQAHKLAFDESGVELTPKSEYDFKFKDYAPYVFKRIRDAFFVDSVEYLQSLTGRYVLSELGSPGKSGSFFYFSSDYRFIIKTISHSEHIFMRQKLKAYYQHIKDNSNTLLSRILGLHRVKLPGNKKIHFGNVFPPHKDIHKVFDLKGSTVGRFLRPENANSPMAVYKDRNWLQDKQQLVLGPEKAAFLAEQMEIDVKFLQENNIMDYSFLIGIHDLVKGNKDFLREKSLLLMDKSAVGTPTETASAPLSAGFDRKSTTNKSRRAKSPRRRRTISDPVMLTQGLTNLSEDSPPERRNVVFYQDFGGFQSTNADDDLRPVVYYIGIIDIFTEYRAKKRAETFFRSMAYPLKKISAVEPWFYGSRFLEFIQKSVVTCD